MPKLFKDLNPEPLVALLGTIATSIVAQPIITTAINVGTKKVSNDTPYPQGIKESITSPLASQVQQSARIMKRRIAASMLPAVFSQEVAKEYGLTTTSRLAINSLIETVLGSLMEPREKFNAANSRMFPMAVDLSKITREGFFKSVKSHESTQSFGEKEWKELEGRQKVFNSNFPMRSLMLLCRNTAFCAASVGAGPLGKEFAHKNAELFEKIGLSPEKSELVSTMIFRAGFACLTTPFDSLATKLSSGELTAGQVMKDGLKHLRHGRLSVLFVGATARTILSTTTSTTVATGPSVGRELETIYESFTRSFSENPLQKILTTDQQFSPDLVMKCDEYFRELSDRLGSGIDVVDDVVETLKIIEMMPNENGTSIVSSALSLHNIGETLERMIFNSNENEKSDPEPTVETKSESSAEPSKSNLQPTIHNPLSKSKGIKKGL